jgi:shikimate dehydrogenase
MHNGVIRRRRLPLRYVAVDLAPGRLPDFLRVVREANVLGGNVTIPFKEEAAALADVRSEAVASCGAANVLRVRDGRLRAENTDGPGFLDALERAGWGRRFRRVVVLGAGGSARGIAHALGRSGTREMVILNRTPARAREMARAIAPPFPRMTTAHGDIIPSKMKEEFRGADLIVQCTSLGLHGEWADFPAEAVEKSTRFADIVYRRGGTALVRELKKRGVRAIDGLPMLAHQAARSFALWTGRAVPAEEFLSLARRALSAPPGRTP